MNDPRSSLRLNFSVQHLIFQETYVISSKVPFSVCLNTYGLPPHLCGFLQGSMPYMIALILGQFCEIGSIDLLSSTHYFLKCTRDRFCPGVRMVKHCFQDVFLPHIQFIFCPES